MRIAILTTSEPLYHPVMFGQLLDRRANEIADKKHYPIYEDESLDQFI